MDAKEKASREVLGLVAGGWDSFFHVGIRDMVRKTAEFAVFVDDDYDVYWRFTQRGESAGAALAGGAAPGDAAERCNHFTIAYSSLLGRVAELEALPADFLSPANRRAFAGLIAEAVALAMESSLQPLPAAAVGGAAGGGGGGVGVAGVVPPAGGDGSPERKTIDAAAAFYDERATETARAWLIQGGLAGVALALFVLLAHHLGPSVKALEISGVQVEFLHAAAFGTMGSAFFLMWRVGSLPKVPAAGPLLHALECAARFATGLVAGIVCELAILARTAPLVGGRAPTTDPKSDLAFLCLLCFAAGATERFLPSLVEKLHQSPGAPSPQKPSSTAGQSPPPPLPGK